MSDTILRQKAERVIMLVYGLAAALSLVGVVVAGLFTPMVGPRASSLWMSYLIQWFLAIGFCALMFVTVLLLLLFILRNDQRIRIRIIALIVSLTPIMLLTSIGLPYSGEYDGEAKIQYLLWRMEKSENPSETDEYRQLETMLTTVTDEESRTAIDRILDRMQSREEPHGTVARLGPFEPKGYVYSAVFSPDGKTLAVCQHQTVRLFETATWKEIFIVPGAIQTAAFSPDGRTLAAGGPGSTVVLHFAATGKKRLVMQGHEKPVFCLSFSPDGRILASASPGDKTVRLWDVEAGKERLKLANSNDVTKSIAFSPDGRTLAWGDGDVLRLSDTTSGKTIREMCPGKEALFRVAWSPDGTMVATSAGGGASKTRLWDASTGKERLAIQAGWCRAFVLFSPDGRWFAFPDVKNTVRIIETATGKELLAFKDVQRTHISNAAAVSPDGRLLATGQWGSTVLVWDVAALLKDRK